MSAREGEIEALEAIRARAIVEADVPALEAMTGETYVHVEGNGALRDKRAFLDVFSGIFGHYTVYDVLENVVDVRGDVAIVTGVFRNEHVSPDGARRGKTGRHVRVYARENGKWTNILHQGTEIRPPDA